MLWFRVCVVAFPRLLSLPALACITKGSCVEQLKWSRTGHILLSSEGLSAHRTFVPPDRGGGCQMTPPWACGFSMRSVVPRGVVQVEGDAAGAGGKVGWQHRNVGQRLLSEPAGTSGTPLHVQNGKVFPKQTLKTLKLLFETSIRTKKGRVK